MNMYRNPEADLADRNQERAADAEARRVASFEEDGKVPVCRAYGTYTRCHRDKGHEGAHHGYSVEDNTTESWPQGANPHWPNGEPCAYAREGGRLQQGETLEPEHDHSACLDCPGHDDNEDGPAEPRYCQGEFLRDGRS